MSFADLERGLGERAPLSRDTAISPEADLAFRSVARVVSIQIHKINANVSAISKLVDLLGTTKDTPDLRKKLHDLTEVTRDVVKDSTGDLKKLAAVDVSPEDRQHRQELQKVSSDYKKAVGAFQVAQTRSAERQRTFVERAKTTLIHDTASGRDPVGNSGSGGARGAGEDGQLLELSEQRQDMMDAIPDSEVEFREQLIQEREGEIEQIEQGIVELNQIFKDIGTLVNDQQSFVDNIATNVYNVGQDTRGASEQLTRAHEYQRRAGRRMFYLLLVFLVVLTIVLLAVRSLRAVRPRIR